MILLGAAAGFLLGSVPWALVLGKGLHGVDVRQRGSRNLGATNAFRVLGARTGAAVLALDVLKGWGAVRVAQWLAAGSADPASAGVAGGLGAVLGHVFSPWVGFRGGKGVAAAAGCFGALAPAAALLAAAAWVVVVALTRTVSVGSLAAAAVLAVGVWVPVDGLGAKAAVVRWLALAVGALVVVRHIPNLRRLVRGEEPRVRLGRSAGEA